MSTSKLDILLSEYGESHQNDTNKFIHWICVPAIMFSLIGLMVSVPTPWEKTWYFNGGSILLLLALAYYFSLSKKIFICFIPIALGLLIGNWMIYKLFHWNTTHLISTSLIIFVVAWIGQFIGHKIEGKKPSFLKDLQFLLIGPAWLLSFIVLERK